MLRSSATSYYEADARGSGFVLANPELKKSITSLSNSSGSIVNTYSYNSFGSLLSSTGSVVSPFRFTARESDSETGLYFYRARYYDSSSGRFLSEDPIGFRGLDINLYRFVRNRPTAFTDAAGLVAVDPQFNPDCLSAPKRALDIVRKLPKKCDCAFRNTGSRRSLRDLLDDPNIVIHSDPQDFRDQDGNQQAAYTYPNDPHNIYFRPIGCRYGRWMIAAKLIHELTHITLGPAVAVQEPTAYGMEANCGLSPLSFGQKAGVAAQAPPIDFEPVDIPGKLEEPQQ